MNIKVGDKFRTRGGHEVEITHVYEKGSYPVYGKIKVWRKCIWSLDGKTPSKEHELDLVTKDDVSAEPKAERDIALESGEMTETNWTPGPHEVVIGEYSTPTRIYGPYQGKPNQLLCNLVGDSHECDANAQLYAASPDLYAATDWVDSKLQTFWSPDMDEVDVTLKYREIRAILAARRRARGE